MKARVIIAVAILALILVAVSCSYGRSKPEVGLAIEEVENLRYEPIDFEKILARPEVMPVSTERDPFKSPFEISELLEAQGPGMLGSESLRLTGIIRGPDGPVALIKPAPEEKARAVKSNSIIGKFRIERIDDDRVILTLNGVKTVLKLGGGK